MVFLGQQPTGEDPRLFLSLASLLPDPEDQPGFRRYVFMSQRCLERPLWVRPWHGPGQALNIHSIFSLQANRPGREETCTQPNIIKGSGGLSEHRAQARVQAGSIREALPGEVMADLRLKK